MNKTFLLQTLQDWYRNVIRNPKYRWWIITGTLLYLVSPIDISPDVLPIVGWLDDGVVITLLVTEISQLMLEKFKTQKQRGQQAEADNNTVIDVETVPVS